MDIIEILYSLFLNIVSLILQNINFDIINSKNISNISPILNIISTSKQDLKKENISFSFFKENYTGLLKIYGLCYPLNITTKDNQNHFIVYIRPNISIKKLTSFLSFKYCERYYELKIPSNTTIIEIIYFGTTKYVFYIYNIKPNITQNSYNIDTCRISTYGKCNTDKDCYTSGCSNEVCQSIYEKPMITPCVYKKCYETTIADCRCVNHKCVWIKIK